MSEKPQKPFLLFGRFAIPLLFWVIIGPIAAVISWMLMKKRANRNSPAGSMRLNVPRRP
jgi:hypothetical protein